MSNRVQFWLGAEDGLASHFLTGPLDRVEAWISNEVMALPRELESILAIVRDARQQGVNALRAENAWRAEQVDRTLDLFYGERELLPLAARAPRDEIPQALASSLVAISQAQTGRVGLITSAA